jgi:hypothetical protein
MTVYNSTKMTAGVQPKFLPTAGGTCSFVQYSVASNLVANDTINMLIIPANAVLNATLLGIELDATKMDTNGSPTLKLDLGDTNSGGTLKPQRFFAADTIAQVGIVKVPTVPASLGTLYTANSTVYVTWNTIAATFAAGTIGLSVTYTYDP